MKKISFWAKNHVFESRIIITVIYILLAVTGIVTGKLLNDINVTLPQFYFLVCTICTIIFWIGYPGIKTVKGKKIPGSYARRKTFDFILGLMTFLLIVGVANNPKLFFNAETAQARKTFPVSTDTSINNHPLIQDFITSIKSRDITRLSEKEKIQIIKKQIRTIQHSKETSQGGKIALIALSVIIAAGLLAGLAVLSCSVACTSSGALAIILMAGGTFLIVFFLVKIIKRISHPPVKKEEGLKNAGTAG
ncbi:MAG: hypothetical protein JWN76_3735 [Chitinophagaceae bacterium]|nr:hypothetical protein [Chitinophagaceae bacterium]